MERLQRILAGEGGMGGHPPPDSPLLDSSEQVYISSLALLKMLKHGRDGVPMEVMGLTLGDFVDEYIVRVVDVFAMSQSGIGVSIEALDPKTIHQYPSEWKPIRIICIYFWQSLSGKQVKEKHIDFEDEEKEGVYCDAITQMVLTTLRTRPLGKRLWKLL
ncbi:hypothetical protein MKW98_020459 [Papaver atlanticum]|uniref:JAB1/MPN/MOV34 metalloenzyme domain-containing protein n=1 Tax=Papaver atlanticum TaxID=357466 RepID=A0AAD4RWF3_9MAGN|nr:hypothetical protein MKW98_020459 [Papaver atlanticum]